MRNCASGVIPRRTSHAWRNNASSQLYRRRKKTLHAAERDETWRFLFARDVQDVDPDALVYLDKSDFHTGMSRTHARSPQGTRAVGPVPRNRGRNLTLLCAMTRQGPCAELWSRVA